MPKFFFESYRFKLVDPETQSPAFSAAYQLLDGAIGNGLGSQSHFW